MFITEGIKLENSAIFMGFMRQALAEQIKEFGGSKEQLEYVIKEASDGDVLSFSMYGESIPKGIDRKQAVASMLEQLKILVLENFKEAEFDGEALAESILGLGIIDENANSIEMLKEGSFSKFSEFDGSLFLENVEGLGDELDRADSGSLSSFFKKLYTDLHLDKLKTGMPGKESSDSGDSGIMSKVTKAWSDIKGFVAKNPQGVGAAAIVAIAAMIGYTVYRIVKKKKEGACAQLSGDAKTACLKKAKIAALQAQIAEQNKAKSLCSKSKDPASCRAKIDAKISKLKAKMN